MHAYDILYALTVHRNNTMLCKLLEGGTLNWEFFATNAISVFRELIDSTREYFCTRSKV